MYQLFDGPYILICPAYHLIKNWNKEEAELKRTLFIPLLKKQILHVKILTNRYTSKQSALLIYIDW